MLRCGLTKAVCGSCKFREKFVQGAIAMIGTRGEFQLPSRVGQGFGADIAGPPLDGVRLGSEFERIGRTQVF